jgi:hypothetical protein
MVTNRDGEVADTWSLCSCIHCRLPEASVCKPSSSVDALSVPGGLVTQDTQNHLDKFPAPPSYLLSTPDQRRLDRSQDKRP